MRNTFRLGMIGIMLFMGHHVVLAQQFGRNKPHYTSFDFKGTQSPHFSLYHYLDNDRLAETFLGTGEKWYAYEQVIFRDTGWIIIPSCWITGNTSL